MATTQSLHSICRWTFNAGKGGFVPASIRPKWQANGFSTADVVELIGKKIRPRIPGHVKLGLEVHCDTEVHERNAAEVADALVANKMYLGMITPGAHSHFGYGGIASLDPAERKRAEDLGQKTVDMAYGVLRKAWSPDANEVPSLVLWNGSYGYDISTIAIRQMYQNLKESVANLCKYEEKLGGEMYMAVEPKPNEGHPAMLLPTVASTIVFWRKIADEFGISIARKGVNKEFGHSEMIGLDHVYDTVEEIDNNMLVHMHLNSQGYNDGICMGGPGKFDIDYGTRINGLNIAIAGLIQQAGFSRWKGHDMQPRAYDNEEQAIDRVVRSVINWECCAQAAAQLDTKALMNAFAVRNTAKAEDIMRQAVMRAYTSFEEWYKG